MGRRTVIGMTFPSFILFYIRATFVFCLTSWDSGLCWASFRPDHAFLSALGYPPFRPRLPFMPSFGTKEDPTQPLPKGRLFPVSTTRESLGTGLLPAFVSQSQRVGQGGVGQCECRSERHSAGNVGHAVVYDAINFVHRLSVCRRV